MADDKDLEQLFKEGIAAIRAGDRESGREKLLAVVERNQLHDQAWLWLSAATNDRDEQIICLENVLTINPRHEKARQGLKKLGIEPPSKPPAPAPPEPDPATAPASTPALPPTGEEASSRVLHAAPDAIDDNLHAMITGAPRPKKKELPPEESWRAALFEEEYISEASIAGSKEAEPIPDRTLGDLADVWLDLLLTSTHGGFKDEIAYGGFLHVLVNIVVASIASALALMLTIVMVFVLPANGFRPPLITSTTEWVSQADPPSIEENSAYGATSLMLKVLGLPDPAEEAERISTEAQTRVQERIASLVNSPGLLITLYGVMLIPLTFIGLMYYSLVANGVANLYGSRGSVMETMHALSLALVVVQGVAVPLAVIIPLLPLGFALVVSTLAGVYQLYVATVAYDAVHKLDRLGSMGMLLMSIVIAAILLGVAGALMMLIIGQIA